jgi:hypothetical protein
LIDSQINDLENQDYQMVTREDESPTVSSENMEFFGKKNL